MRMKFEKIEVVVPPLALYKTVAWRDVNVIVRPELKRGEMSKPPEKWAVAGFRESVPAQLLIPALTNPEFRRRNLLQVGSRNMEP